MRLALAFVFGMAGAALAQDYPALHDVTGVAGDDRLNLRSRPTVRGEVIGTLAPDAKGIEIIAEENGWGRLNLGGQSGWAKLSLLAPVAGSALPQAAQFTCFGTEPFWSLSVTPGAAAVLTRPEGAAQRFALGPLTTASGRVQPFAALGRREAERMTLVVSRGQCSDGMSDALYGLEAVVVTGGPGTRVYSGCCSLAAR